MLCFAETQQHKRKQVPFLRPPLVRTHRLREEGTRTENKLDVGSLHLKNRSEFSTSTSKCLTDPIVDLLPKKGILNIKRSREGQQINKNKKQVPGVESGIQRSPLHVRSVQNEHSRKRGSQHHQPGIYPWFYLGTPKMPGCSMPGSVCHRSTWWPKRNTE